MPYKTTYTVYIQFYHARYRPTGEMVKRQLVLNTYGIILALNFIIFGHRRDTFHIFYNVTVGYLFFSFFR